MSSLSFTKMLSSLSSSDPESSMATSDFSCSSVSSLLSACLPALDGDITSLLVTAKLSRFNVKVGSSHLLQVNCKCSSAARIEPKTRS